MIGIRCLSGVLLLVFQQFLFAQEASEPDIENNIVCYAAKNKWVCAPADDQVQAQEKARKLALGQSLEDDEDIDPTAVSPVTSTTASQRPISRQPDDNVRRISRANDFIPRSDALNNKPDQVVESQQHKPTPAEQPVTVAEQVQTEPVVTTRPMQDVVAEPAQTPEDGSTVFSSWQRDYPNHWSYQVIGTSNRHKLDEFINRHQLSQWPFSIVKTQVNGADWWVVLVGLYDSRDSAIDNRDQLPAVLAGGAWVRQINTIIGESG